MVIQRMQTLFLFIAAVLMALFSLMPFASVTVGSESASLCPTDFPVYLIINILTVILLFLAIFTYKNLKLQKKVTLLSMLLIICSIVTGIFLIYGPNAPIGDIKPVFAGGVTLLGGALLCAALALRGIKKDQRILSSYDRIR